MVVRCDRCPQDAKNIYKNILITVIVVKYGLLTEIQYFNIDCNHNSTIWENSSMSQVLQEVLSANGEYAATFGKKANLPLPPARRFAILTCMDARLDPAKYALAGTRGCPCHS